MAQQVGQLLRNQDSDLLHQAAQLEEAHVEAWVRPLDALPVVEEFLLGRGG